MTNKQFKEMLKDMEDKDASPDEYKELLVELSGGRKRSPGSKKNIVYQAITDSNERFLEPTEKIATKMEVGQKTLYNITQKANFRITLDNLYALAKYKENNIQIEISPSGKIAMNIRGNDPIVFLLTT